MVKIYLADIGRKGQESRAEAHIFQSEAARRLLLKALKREYPELAGDFRIEKDSRGKPYLAGHREIHISISHSGSLAACAVADRAVGVDVEFRRKRPGPDRISRRFHTEEQEWLSRQPEEERDRAFYDLWVRKESFMKAVGEGLRIRLDSFSTVDGLGGADSLYFGRSLEVAQNFRQESYFIRQYEAGDARYSLAVCSEENSFSETLVYLQEKGENL